MMKTNLSKQFVSEFQLLPPGSDTGGSMFKGRHFDRSVILLCVRWYLAYNLSLRHLEEMMAERGVSVDHATIHRWTLRYAPERLERFTGTRGLSLAGGTSTRPTQSPRPVAVSLSGDRQQW
jgi:hypothetical protein